MFHTWKSNYKNTVDEKLLDFYDCPIGICSERTFHCRVKYYDSCGRVIQDTKNRSMWTTASMALQLVYVAWLLTILIRWKEKRLGIFFQTTGVLHLSIKMVAICISIYPCKLVLAIDLDPENTKRIWVVFAQFGCQMPRLRIKYILPFKIAFEHDDVIKHVQQGRKTMQ